MARIILLYVPTKNVPEAKRLAQRLIKGKLAACANILPAMTSIFPWNGKISASKESLLLVKTTAPLAKRAEACILKYHSYDVPCVITIATTRVNSRYLAWLTNSLTDASSIT